MKSGLETFFLTHLRFTLRALEVIHLPRMNKAITLRGAFGEELRRLVCFSKAGNCSQCPARASCAYAIVFAPTTPENAKRLRLNRDLPRPFVIKPPLDGKTVYLEGEELIFELVLVGKALELFPYIIVSFNNLADRGIGVGRGAFKIRNIEVLDGTGKPRAVLAEGNSMVTFPDTHVRFQDVPWPAPSRVHVIFHTPVLLKQNQQWTRPAFGPFMKRLRDRLNALSCFYCDGALEMPFRSFGHEADEKVRVVSEDLQWIEENRFSKNHHLQHKLKGWVGAVVYEGQLADFWPFLWIGQYVHVGKSAAFGQGWYRIVRSEKGCAE